MDGSIARWVVDVDRTSFLLWGISSSKAFLRRMAEKSATHEKTNILGNVRMGFMVTGSLPINSPYLPKVTFYPFPSKEHGKIGFANLITLNKTSSDEEYLGVYWGGREGTSLTYFK